MTHKIPQALECNQQHQADNSAAQKHFFYCSPHINPFSLDHPTCTVPACVSGPPSLQHPVQPWYCIEAAQLPRKKSEHMTGSSKIVGSYHIDSGTQCSRTTSSSFYKLKVIAHLIGIMRACAHLCWHLTTCNGWSFKDHEMTARYKHIMASEVGDAARSCPGWPSSSSKRYQSWTASEWITCLKKS